MSFQLIPSSLRQAMWDGLVWCDFILASIYIYIYIYHQSPDDRLVRETQGSDSSKNLSVSCIYIYIYIYIYIIYIYIYIYIIYYLKFNY